MATGKHKQDLSGTLIRSIIQGGVEPAPLTLRAEVLQVVRECADTIWFWFPFCDRAVPARAHPGAVHVALWMAASHDGPSVRHSAHRDKACLS